MNDTLQAIVAEMRAAIDTTFDEMAETLDKCADSLSTLQVPARQMPEEVREALKEMDAIRAVGKPFVPHTAYDIIRKYLEQDK